MRRLSWCVGFLLILSGCGRSGPSPPSEAASSATIPGVVPRPSAGVATSEVAQQGGTGILPVVSKGTSETPVTPPPAVAPFGEGHQEAWAKHFGVPVVATNSIGMKLVLIPPGEFEMGSTREESAWAWQQRKGAPQLKQRELADAEPQHRVKLARAFCLGMYPVTRDEYKKVMGVNPSAFAAKQSGVATVNPKAKSKGGADKKITANMARAAAGKATGDYPVETVAWSDAVEFCRRLSVVPAEQSAGRVYRLPTEAEWEYACRAQSTTPWYFGDDAANLGEYAWFSGNSAGTPHRVGQKKPNAWGLYDMNGLVWQWCSDWFGAYQSSSAADPTGPETGDRRVCRGGSFRNGAVYLRSAYRASAPPNLLDAAHGFRVAVEIAGQGVTAAVAATRQPPPVTKVVKASENLLSPFGFEPLGQGFERQRETFFCDNGENAKVARGVVQTVELRQSKPEPIFALAYSKAEGVTGPVSPDYAVYLGVQYTDGSWSVAGFSAFDVGTHDWQRREAYFMPLKPISRVRFNLLLRSHAGKAWFRLPELYKVRPPDGGAPVAVNRPEPVTLVDSDFSELPALPASVTTPGKPAISVAVLDFVDKGPSVELANLRTALAEMLAGDLSQYEGLRVVERMQVGQVLGERNLQQGLTDQAATTKIGKALAAEYLVTGAFSGKADAVTVELSLSKTGEPKPLAEWKERVPLAKLASLEQQLAAKILAGVGIAQPKHRAPPKPQPGPSPLVAVLAFRNLSPSVRLAAMEGGFADILQDNLSAVKNVRLVEREKLHAVLREQNLSLSGLADPATAVKVGKLLGAQRLVFGSFVEMGDDLRLDVRLADSQTAAVLAAETATGKSADFGTLLEGLAVRVAADLAVQPDTDAVGRMKAASPIRTIEAAVHLADGDKAFAAQQYEAAAKAYERVLLADPKNIAVGMRRTQALFELRDYRRAVEAGEQTLAAGLSPKDLAPGDDFGNPRVHFFWMMIWAYSGVKDLDKERVFCQRIIDECPSRTLVNWARSCIANLASSDPDRIDAAAGILKDAVEAARKKNDAVEYSAALRTLWQYYEHNAIFYRADPARIWNMPKEVVQKLNARAIDWQRAADDILDVALKAAEASHAGCWTGWADTAVRRAKDIKDAKVRYDMLQRVLRTMSWVGYVPRAVHTELGPACFQLERWEEAVKSHRYLLDHPQEGLAFYVPDWWEIEHHRPDSPMDQTIESMHTIAWIKQNHLKQPEEAERICQDIVDRYGLVVRNGPAIAECLHELGKKPVIPPKAALVWGGRDTTQKTWDAVLGPMGFKTHMVAQYTVSEAHLAPYSLVVLARQGMIPYAPDDILALRSYVATGGSLLVIVSPGWEPSQPGNQNSLLWLFGVQADQEMEIRAKSTKIVPHAITENVTSVIAKNAVNLKVPQGTGLIQAGDRTVLAAFPYRQGRVVVASFGQWFMPSPFFPANGERIHHWSNQLPRESLPLEYGPQRELPLLANVIRWLIEPRPDEEQLQDRRKPFSEARAASLNVQFNLAPRDSLKDAMKRLIAEAPGGVWKEEALWTAGEASMRWAFLGVRDWLGFRAYAYPLPQGPWQPDAEYYERLVAEFPQSPLRPLAQWRLADCVRRKATADQFKALGYITFVDQGESIPAFEKVDAAKGTYPWAWAHLWIGNSHASHHRPNEAVAQFREVAETMPTGPEKSMALLNLGLILRQEKGRADETVRWLQAARDTPDISWFIVAYNGWGPLKPPTAPRSPSTTHAMANEGLKALRSGAKK